MPFPTSYEALIYMIDHIFRHAPPFGPLGPPMYMIMFRVMDTQGGFSAFTKENLNREFKEMFKAWARFLTSKDSRYVLNKKPDGWLSDAAIKEMLTEYGDHKFEDVFVCDTNDEHYGYSSFEDFFNRRFSQPEDVRPTCKQKNDDIVVSSATESTSYAYQENVKRYDEFFIKDEAYSLQHLLAGHHVDEFVGGTVLQSFLGTKDYHRWHAPVNGTISQIVDIPGTYFAQAPSTIGDPPDPNPDPEGPPPPYLRSLRFFSNTAARQLIFIRADDSQIGLMCVVSIGMTEISSCQATVYEGQHVVRGEELGMFHFGGSSSALVFRHDSGVTIDKTYTTAEVPMWINWPLNMNMPHSPLLPPARAGHV